MSADLLENPSAHAATPVNCIRIIAIALLGGLVAAGCSSMRADAWGRNTPGAADTGKIAPALRARARVAGSNTLAVLIRTTGAPTAAERRSLREAGVAISAVRGDIVAGRVPAVRIGRLASFWFVRYIELATALTGAAP